MFGKLMSVSDELMWRYYLLLTDYSVGEIDAIKASVSEGAVHPKQAKSDLARRIVADFHSTAEADRAAAAFEARFSRGELQIDDLPVLTIDIDDESVGLAKLLSLAGLASSASDATRKIQQGGARVNREKVSDPRMRIEPAAHPVVLEVGRKAVRAIVRRTP